MKILKDESAQTGIILFIIIGLFIMGLVFVMFGALMDQTQTANNNLINDSSLPYSQNRADAMTNIFDTLKYFPLYILILFIIYGVKRAIEKQSGEI